MTKESHDKNKLAIQIDIDNETAQGTYSNLALSNFSKEEFILDFAFIQPNIKKGKIRSRIILTPKNAKRLMIMLKKNIKEYEEKSGPITDEKSLPGINLSFN